MRVARQGNETLIIVYMERLPFFCILVVEIEFGALPVPSFGLLHGETSIPLLSGR